jgi:hypothetical protein
MDPRPSSQDVQIPTVTDANVGDTEMPAVKRSNAPTNGHANAGLEKTLEASSPDTINVESNSEEGEEREDDGLGTRSVSSDDGDGPHDVPLNNDRPNVCFTLLPPSPEHQEA